MKSSKSHNDVGKVRKTKKLKDQMASSSSKSKGGQGGPSTSRVVYRTKPQHPLKNNSTNTSEKSEPTDEEDDFKSPLFVNGFVIITPSVDVDPREDELTLPEWISDRLQKMNIIATVVSLNELRKYPYFSEDNDGNSLDDEFSTLMNAELEEISPLWKIIMKKGMVGWSSEVIKKSPQEKKTQPVNTKEVKQLFLYFKDVVLRKMTSDNLVWVLIVPNEFKNSMEVDLLHAMSEQFCFRVLALSSPYKSNILRMLVAIAERKEELVWQTNIKVSQKKRSNENDYQNSKITQEKVSPSQSDHRNNNSENKASIDLQTLHKERNFFQLSPKNMSLEKIMIEDYENEAHISGYPESILSSDSEESSTFEMSEENLFMCLSQAIKTIIPRPLNPKEYFRQPISMESVPRSLVIIIRDMAGCNSNSLSLAKTIQERLSKMAVRSYVIPVPNILKDLQAVKLTREHAVRIAHESDKDILDGYIRLILAIIANKMKNKTQRVIIVDIGDESAVRLWPVKDFCMRLHAEIFTLDSLPESQFESNLSKVIHEVSKRYKKMDWTTSVPIYDDNENLQEPQNFELTDPEYLLSLQHKKSFKNENTDEEHSKSHISESQRDSESSIEKEMEASEEIVIPDEEISGANSDSGDTSSQSSNQTSSANKTKRRKKRRTLDKRSRSALSTGFKSKASTSTTSSMKELLKSTANNNVGIDDDDDDNNENENNCMNEIFNPKLNLLTIQKVPDEYPSRLSSNLMEQDLSKEEGTYKGWVAVENDNPDRSTRYIAHKFRSKSTIKPDMEVHKPSKDGFFKRIMRPIGLFITCQYCKSNRNSQRVSPEERLGYKGISLENAHRF